MTKDHFYYCLRDRLEFAQEYAHGYITHLKNLEFRKKADREFYKKHKLLFILEELINLPTNLYNSYNETRGKLGLKKCLNETKNVSHEHITESPKIFLYGGRPLARDADF